MHVERSYQEPGKFLPAEIIPDLRWVLLLAYKKQQMMVSQIPAYFNSERIALRIKNYLCFTEAKILEYLLLEKLPLNE